MIRTASLSLLLIATLATAGVVDTPQCRQDLARAGQLISAIRDRERQFQRGNIPLACRLWRQNVTEMSRARDLMFPCLTGRERGENIGQLDASLEDIRYAIQRNCP